jgi:hypothetical protein
MMTLKELELTGRGAPLWIVTAAGKVECVLFQDCDEVDRTNEEVYAGVPQRARARVTRCSSGPEPYAECHVSIADLFPSHEAADAEANTRAQSTP